MHTPLNLQGKEGRNVEGRTKGAVGRRRREDAESCRKKEGKGPSNARKKAREGAVDRQKEGKRELPKEGGRGCQPWVETEESQRRDLRDRSEDATEQRPKGPTQQRREGPRGSQRERQAQEPRDRGGSRVESQIKGAIWTKNRRLLKHHLKPIKGAKAWCPGDWRPQQANRRQ